MEQPLREGYSLKKVYKVTKEVAAKMVGSGSLPVLATPVLACWVEEAAFNLLELSLEDEMTSVGTKLDINHISPTPIGLKVAVQITVEEIDNRRYVFSFKAKDQVQEIANGIHERVIVNKKNFMSKVLEKKYGSK